jgi:predicted phage terminase large subunit-like protein
MSEGTQLSLADRVALLPDRDLRELITTDDEAYLFTYDWKSWARPVQMIPEEDWLVWLIRTGRGWGKTRTGAETVRYWVENCKVGRIALIADTPADARDVMIEGESGLLSVSPPWFKPIFESSKRRLTWPNGAIATIYSGANPDQLRGPQHEKAWCDELASWQYARETWDNLMLGLRLGDNPQVIITTTPKPISLLKEIRTDKSTHLTSGSIYDNRANLTSKYYSKIVSMYEGTSLQSQELYGEEMTESPGALWKRADIGKHRVKEAPDFVRIVVSIDPAVTSNETSNETGIIVAGRGTDGHAYILDDKSCRKSPLIWANVAIKAYNDRKADRIVAETNNGGEMVETTVRTVDETVSYKGVHASRGKITRAEPVASLYEQGKVHHVGVFPDLEDQLCTWEPGDESPDRLDATVWAITELLLGSGGSVPIVSPGNFEQESRWHR